MFESEFQTGNSGILLREEILNRQSFFIVDSFGN